MTTTPPATAAPARTRAAGRLGQGELRRKVAGWLAANPGAWKPGKIAGALGHSAGAVGNALATLEARGEAAREPGSPVRYSANAATAGAATAPPRPATAPRRPPVPPASPTAPSATPPPAGHSPGPGSPAPVRPGGPVTRPNGQVYRPRSLADMPDVEALRRLRDAGIPVLLYGPPGTGKTSLAEAAFGDLITLAGDGDTTVADFAGDYTQADDGRYEFVYGPLVTAMTEGRALLIDDATLISPKVLAVVYPAMDGRRQITVKAHKGETITAAEGFYVIAGHNPGVHGAVLTDALASRFSVQIQVGTDFDLAHALKIDSRAIRVARNLATRQVKGEIGWAPQLRELIAFGKIADVLGMDAAAANLTGIAPEEDRDVVTEVVTTVFGRPMVPLALGRQI
jgi:nitric oxide reductase NorQ protein